MADRAAPALLGRLYIPLFFGHLPLLFLFLTNYVSYGNLWGKVGIFVENLLLVVVIKCLLVNIIQPLMTKEGSLFR